MRSEIQISNVMLGDASTLDEEKKMRDRNSAR